MLWVLLFCARSGEITARINDVEISNSTFENIVRDFGDPRSITEIMIVRGHLTYSDLESLRNVTFEAEHVELIEFQENCSVENGTIPDFAFAGVTCGTIRIESLQCQELSFLAFQDGVFDNIIANRVTYITENLENTKVSGSLELNAVETISYIYFCDSSIGTFQMNSAKYIEGSVILLSSIIDSFQINGTNLIEDYFICDNSSIGSLVMESLESVSSLTIDGSWISLEMNTVSLISVIEIMNSVMNYFEMNSAASAEWVHIEESSVDSFQMESVKSVEWVDIIKSSVHYFKTSSVESVGIIYIGNSDIQCFDMSATSLFQVDIHSSSLEAFRMNSVTDVYDVSFVDSSVTSFDMNNTRWIRSTFLYQNSSIEVFEMNAVEYISWLMIELISLQSFKMNSVICVDSISISYSSLKLFQMNSVSDVTDFGFVNCSVESFQMNSLTSFPNIQVGQTVFQHVEMNSLTFIGSSTFSNLGVVSASFESVQEIGDDSFSYCENLEEIKCGELNRIGECAFEWCRSLHTINCTFSRNATIERDAFYLCDKLTSIDISCLSNITDYSFYGCSLLSTIDLSSALTVGTSSFNRCTGLTHITAPVLESVGEQAFSFCRGVVNISMPKLLYMGSNCFAQNTELATIHFPRVENMSSSCFMNCYCLERVDLPASWIGDRCFCYCQSLSTVVLNYATYIGPNTFDYCDYLTEVSVNDLTECGDKLFYFCNLESFYAESLKIVSDSLFEKCKRLMNVRLPKCEEIREYGFSGTSCANVIELPSLLKICANAFRGSEIVQLRIPALEEVGDYAFAEIDYLVFDLIDVQSFTAKVIGEFVFMETEFNISTINLSAVVDLSPGNIDPSVTSLTLANLKIARNGTFSDLPNLTRLELPSLESFNGSLTRNCPQLSEIIVPNLKACKARAFANFKSLKKISLDSIVNISESCFEDCAALESIFAPNIRRIGNSAFMNCYSLCMINGETTLNLTNLESIEGYAFCGCRAIKEIITNIGTIKDHAFCGCHSLRNISIEFTQTIESSAFEDCTSLESIDGPRVRNLDRSAFQNCISLRTVRLERLITLESDYHFYNCTNLTSIYLVSLDTVPDKSENIFGNCFSLSKIWLKSIPPETFHADVFRNTGRDTIEMNGVKVMNIIMCASSYSSYSCSGPGCGEHQWKYLYSGEIDDYESECGYPSSARDPTPTPTPSQSWWEQNRVIFTVALPIIFVITGVSVLVFFLFKRERKKTKDYDRHIRLTRLVLDDFG